MPPAPLTFSMTTCWPKSADRGAAENPRQGGGGAARRERHHHRDRPARPVLRLRVMQGNDRRDRGRNGKKGKITPIVHCVVLCPRRLARTIATPASVSPAHRHPHGCPRKGAHSQR